MILLIKLICCIKKNGFLEFKNRLLLYYTMRKNFSSTFTLLQYLF